MSAIRIRISEPEELDISELLAVAIRAGNVPRVLDLLPQQTTPVGFSLLEAACCGQRDVLELLIDAAGVMPLTSTADALGRTPLHLAAANGDYGAAQLLIARGADVNAHTVDNVTAVGYAAASGHRGLIQLLLDAGGDAGTRSVDGATPMLMAAEAGHCHCVEVFVQKGADVNAADASGTTPLLAALAGGHRRTAEALLNAGSSNGGRVGGRTALHWAAYHGMAGVLRQLLAGAGAADIDAEDATGETALLRAARRGHHTAVELLLQHGASTEKANRGGVTPLIASSLFGHDSAVAALLARGAAIAVFDSTHRRTPLHWAALADAAESARMLLERGADGGVTDARGATAMDLAVEHDCSTVVQVFISFSS